MPRPRRLQHECLLRRFRPEVEVVVADAAEGDLLGLCAGAITPRRCIGTDHSETWAGCIVSVTTPTRSLLSVCRSVVTKSRHFPHLPRSPLGS
jgi:hypothetical protein